jgi:hypothetical protein
MNTQVNLSQFKLALSELKIQAFWVVNTMSIYKVTNPLEQLLPQFLQTVRTIYQSAWHPILPPALLLTQHVYL